MAEASGTSREAAAIAAALDQDGDRAVNFLQSLIQAAQDGEAAIQVRVAGALRNLGCRIEDLRYRPAEVPLTEEFAANHAVPPEERHSVIGMLPGSGHGKSLMLFSHPDPEPIKGLDRWRHDPFAGTLENGRLYGWGAADDLSGVAMMVEGLRLALAAGFRPAGDVVLASTPSKRHARGVAAILHHGYRADAAVYLHPAESGVGMREIKAFAPGQLEFRVTVAGRLPDTNEPAHTAFAHRAVSAIDKAWCIYRALRELDAARGERVRHAALDGAVGRSTNLQISHMRSGEEDRLSRLDKKCVLGGALSFPPPEKLASVQQEVEQAISRATMADPWLRENPPMVEWIAGVGAAETKADHALYRTVAGAIVAATGVTPQVNPLHTASDIRNPIIQKGIPTVGFGPLCGDLTMSDGHDEWVDAADYLRAVQATALTIHRWCS